MPGHEQKKFPRGVGPLQTKGASTTTTAVILHPIHIKWLVLSSKNVPYSTIQYNPYDYQSISNELSYTAAPSHSSLPDFIFGFLKLAVASIAWAVAHGHNTSFRKAGLRAQFWWRLRLPHHSSDIPSWNQCSV